MSVLLTGAAGFIGFHAARRLLADGHWVVEIDSPSDYYDLTLMRFFDMVTRGRRIEGMAKA